MLLESAGLAGARDNLLARHPLVWYSVLAYGITWLVDLPFVLSAEGAGWLPYTSPINDDLLLYTASFGPLAAALIMAGVTEGRAGIRRLLQGIVLWRVSPWWYLFALVGLPMLLMLGTIAVPGNLASFHPTDPARLLMEYLPYFVYPALLVGGPLGEEPGWRGFALPRLQRQYGPLVGTLILGPLWAFWHVPLWLTAWRLAGMQNVYNVVLFVLFISTWTFVFTWVFNSTRGSVLLAILVHTSGDAFPNAILGPLFPASTAVTANGVNVGYFGLIVTYGVFTLLFVALTRGRLCYDRYQREAGVK
ncbi:MAG TPA: CPBP family intramembrane glutamic endopeptidase [Chloroflexota bacterium]